MISCFLVADGKYQKAQIPEGLLSKLIVSLRKEGTQTVHFADKSVSVEGVFIPAVGAAYTVALINKNDMKEE